MRPFLEAYMLIKRSAIRWPCKRVFKWLTQLERNKTRSRSTFIRIPMLGNSLISTNNMPRTLAELTGAEVICHARGGARLSEQLSLGTRLGTRTHMALTDENWDYVVLQDRKENRCV